ncbi:phosphatase PAP2 family protein [Halobacteriovorax sp. HLS]|uniref:phosphatase PAP2 family protein n=1 Tax=Halobacteriovorax sp. HLS TaxID=2234000 RepID=UPI0013E2D462|nr:phosphatase PAP2 family protein [Halobacteriovorax sp. HLS]
MKIALFILLLSFNSFAIVNNKSTEHVRESKLDISPPQVKYLSLFFATEMATLWLINPDYVRSASDTGDFQYNKDDLSVPEWAYFFGNHGPTLMTIALYSNYLYQNSSESFDKAFVLTESLLISQGITFGAKYAFRKQRPDESNYLSFPSGHTTHAFTLGSWMSLELYRSKSFSKNKVIASLPMIYSIYIGWTRIDANKHSFTDVLGGAVIGTITSYLMYNAHFDEYGNYRYKSKMAITPTIDPINKSYGLNWRMKF